MKEISTEARLRRTAQRRGMTLEKCRRRDKFAIGYGKYTLIGAKTKHEPYTLTLEDVARLLDE